VLSVCALGAFTCGEFVSVRSGVGLVANFVSLLMVRSLRVGVVGFYPTGGSEIVGEHRFACTAFRGRIDKRTDLLQMCPNLRYSQSWAQSSQSTTLSASTWEAASTVA